MSGVKEIEQAIKALSPGELQSLRAWFAEQDAASWDTQFESDAQSGKLDSLASEALDEHRCGKSTLL